MTWEMVFKSKGLHWEEIPGVSPPGSFGVDKLYSIRLTQARRARVFRQGNVMRFVDIPKDHDSAYH